MKGFCLIKAYSDFPSSDVLPYAEENLCSVQKAYSFICPWETHITSHSRGRCSQVQSLRWGYLHKVR